jgi:hypothetical protein
MKSRLEVQKRARELQEIRASPRRYQGVQSKINTHNHPKKKKGKKSAKPSMPISPRLDSPSRQKLAETNDRIRQQEEELVALQGTLKS